MVTEARQGRLQDLVSRFGCFSDADRQRVWRARHLGVRETCTDSDFLHAAANGAAL
jgi:hypothetical protein